MLSPPNLQYAFTLHVELAPALHFGQTTCGDRRFIPITGGSVTGPKLNGKIVPYSGGDWNAVRSDDVVHVYARYSIQADDGTLIGIINEGYGRASPETMKSVFVDDDPSLVLTRNESTNWYTRTIPRFEVGVENKQHQWLERTVFLGDLKPPVKAGWVEIDVFEVL
ncbi:hypothetical protein ABZX51_009520 [Aspergillus tubingensis]|uniref:Uncharacterized protein n=1 Tax=Aspergillus niger TaxID=5061 RepID=A0A124BYL1_ASPNG|nr:hypothetical protein AUEXF2481DRAFT_91673 [Aspergillus niger]